jgi:DNA polymerase bacteriophage-type
MNYLFLDLETRCDLSVKDVGAFAYAEHPSTEILCCAYAIDDEPVRVLTFEDVRTPALRNLLEQHADAFHVAHNVDFEKNVLSQKVDAAVLQRRWIDTAAWAAGLGLPRKLEDLLKFLFPDDPAMLKDMVGNRIMLRLSQPRKPSKSNPDKWWTPATKPAEFERLYSYCKQDVEGMRAAFKKLRPLDEREQRIWEITDRMNWWGVKLDTASLPLAQAHLARALAPLEAEWATLCPHPPKSYAAVAKHLGMTDVKKTTVRHALREVGLDPLKRRALELLRLLAVSSPAKLQAMIDRVSSDGRLRGALVYGGAERTLRWSSWGVQLQNMKRGLGALTDAAFEALALDVLGEVFCGVERQAPEQPADAIALVAEMMRGFLLGPFYVGDYAQIEARTLAWLAGEEPLLKTFREKGDPYCAMASKIYGKPITKKDKQERFLGKQVVLGCGYQMGHVRFKNMLDEIYDVEIDEAFAKKVVNTYRASVPSITKLWKVLQAGFTFAVQQRAKHVKVGPVYMGTETVGGIFYATITLPSGRKLWYADAQIHGKEIRYYGRNIYKGGAWELVPTHGGKVAENITQALSRDIMAEAMLRLDAAGFKLLLTVHDEVVAEDDGAGRLDEFHRIMCEVPSWAAGLPIEAETFSCLRYRK